MRKTALALLASLLLSPPAPAKDGWYEIDKQVCNDIEARGLAAVVQSYGNLPLKAAQSEWIKAFDAASRADDPALISKALSSLANEKNRAEKSDLSHMANFLIGRKQWKLATSFVERFPEAEPGWGYVLVDEISRNQSYEKTDAWLKLLAAHNADYWTGLRAGAAHKAKREQSLLHELEADVRKTPDIDRVRRYVAAVKLGQAKPDLLWLFDVYKPHLAFDSWQVSSILETRFSALCQRYLELSLSQPYTSEDEKRMVEYMKKCSSLGPPQRQTMEKYLRMACKQMLAQCYQAQGKSTKAQTLLLELQRAYPGPMPSFALTQFAGQIQAATQLHPLEQKIKQAEKVNENDPQYWLGRTRYYLGRNDERQAYQSLVKAMDVSKLRPTVDDAQIMVRMMVLSDYSRFLRRNGNTDVSRKFLWSQFEQTNSAALRGRIVNEITNVDPDALKYDEPFVWQFLKEQKDWDYREEHVLMNMCQRCPEQARGKLWQDLKVIADTNPTRLLRLGWVMTRNNENSQAILILEEARQKLTDAEQKQIASFTLMEAQISLNNWQAAERLFPEARKRLQPSELPEWISKICIAGARSGASNDAMRLWRSKDNLDRTYIEPLRELRKFNELREQLKRYYEEQLAREPAASVPRQALDILR